MRYSVQDHHLVPHNQHGAPDEETLLFVPFIFQIEEIFRSQMDFHEMAVSFKNKARLYITYPHQNLHIKKHVPKGTKLTEFTQSEHEQNE